MESINIKINVKDLIKSNPELDVKELVNKILKLSEENDEPSKKEFDQAMVLEVIKAINSILVGKEGGKDIYPEVYSFDYKDKTNLKIYLRMPVKSIPLIIERMQELKLEIFSIENKPIYRPNSFCLDIRHKN